MSLIKWKIKQKKSVIPEDVAAEFRLSPLLKEVLEVRGISGREGVRRAVCTDGIEFHDPFLMKDMKNAVKRIEAALAEGEKIAVYGDYDVDGVTSVYVLSSYLRARGAEVFEYIPEREGEGYGINRDALQKIADTGAGLVVTVDSGVTAAKEIAFAREIGLDAVVTDHHEPGQELPVCAAVINPRRPDCGYPFKELAGVGVVFKLLCALEGGSETVFEEYGDMVALGTVADVMSLTDENRTIVARGLAIMKNTKNTGLSALIKEACAGEIGVMSIGYRIAPRLNAAGRMSSALEALALLNAKDADRAQRAAQSLCSLNKKRQDYEAEIFNRAVEMVESDRETIEAVRSIVLYDRAWKHGVIGIVASRLAEKYGLPTILMTVEDGDAKGSARSVEGFNICAAMSRAVSGLGSCGGHIMAAGVKLPAENIEKFKQAFYSITSAEMEPETARAPLEIDCEITPDMADIRQAADLSRLEPYGEGNLQPLFCMRGIRITSISPIGAGKHTKLVFEKSSMVLNAVYFGVRPESLAVSQGDYADAAFNLEINTYRGYNSVRLNMKDLRPERDAILRAERAMLSYRELTETDVVAGELRPPEREVFAAVWRALSDLYKKGTPELTPALLYKSLGNTCGAAGELDMLVALRAFFESGLLSDFKLTGFYGEMSLAFNLKAPQKVDLKKTGIISKLIPGCT